MNNDSPHLAKLNEVTRLATLVADRILDAQITSREIPSEQMSALVSAARLLSDQGVPWPPLVEQVVHEFGRRLAGAGSAPEARMSEPEGDNVVAGLTRFMTAFRREKGAPDER